MKIMDEKVAVIEIDNLPVNSLNLKTRIKLHDDIKKASRLDNIEALVLVGIGKCFSAGGDIKEFDEQKNVLYPTTHDLIDAIRKCEKPVIAALNGLTLGGGLELALACDWRMGVPGIRMGLPETNLGLIPGAGGTQRLPRLVGVRQAFQWIHAARLLSTKEAYESGVLDAISTNDLLEDAVQFARALDPHGPKRADRWLYVSDAPSEGRALQEIRRDLELANALDAKTLALLECMENAIRCPIDQGCDREKELFAQLLRGSQARALRHLFTGQRKGKKDKKGGKTLEDAFKLIGVVGAGTMGRGIAAAFAGHGFKVVLVDQSKEAISKARETIGSIFERRHKRGRIDADQLAAYQGNVDYGTSYEALGKCDLIIEAVFEDLDVKRETFRKLSKIARPDAIIASNTSRLDINLLAGETQRPSQVLGLHFFSPAHVMKLVEVVRGDTVTEEILALTRKLLTRIGKIPVTVGVCEGFVGNRMLAPLKREAYFLVEEGASPAFVDAALEKFGMAMGPLRVQDMAGLDLSWSTRKRLEATRDKSLRYSTLPDKICELGRFGQKTGAGIYRYVAGSKKPIPDPLVEQLARQSAKEAGIKRRHVSEEEVVERCIYSLVNEGCRVVEDRIVENSSDIDVIYANGYGFPKELGGPMFYADEIGLNVVYESLLHYYEKFGGDWKPSELLLDCMRRHVRLSDMTME